MEDIPQEPRKKQRMRPPAAFRTLQEYKQMLDFGYRAVEEYMDRDKVKEHIFDKEIKHPIERTMVHARSGAFDEAVTIVTNEIINAKRTSKIGVHHTLCCNVLWLGVTPNVNCHIMNEKFREYLDQRNIDKANDDPDFLPVKPRLFNEDEEEQLGVRMNREDEAALIERVNRLLFGEPLEPQMQLFEQAEESDRESPEKLPRHSYAKRTLKGKKRSKKLASEVANKTESMETPKKSKKNEPVIERVRWEMDSDEECQGSLQETVLQEDEETDEEGTLG